MIINHSNVGVFAQTEERKLEPLGSVLLSTVAVCLLAAGSAGAAVEAPNPKDLTVGKWELQLALSKFCKAAPQRVA
jgi:hypothetical protein